MIKKMLLVFLCISLFLSIPGCKKKLPTSPDIPAVILPTIEYFTATPDSIDYFQESTLKWKVINANKVEIDNGIGEVALEGMKEIAPTKTTTYVLTATNNYGQVQKSCIIEIAPWFLEPPTINYFIANPSQILWGESFTLGWSTSNASYWIITGNNGVTWFESTRIDEPGEEHAFTMWPHRLAEWSESVIITFTLTATNDNGQVQESCTIEVIPGFADVVMIWGPTGGVYGNSYIYTVSGGVKNTGSMPAINTKVSVELYGSPGDLLASGDCLVGGDGFKLEPQQQAGWSIDFDDTSGVLRRQMDWDSEITYEITWQTAQGMWLAQTGIVPFN